MTTGYLERYDNIAFRREDGVLEVRLHTRGGPARWAAWGGLHRQLGPAFHDIAQDREVRAIILTGTGDSFCQGYDDQGEAMPKMGPAVWDALFNEGRRMLHNLLAIEVPVIAAVNGPALIHAELAVLSDIVLASQTARFADKAHAIAGVVPGDGVHSVWPMLLGPNRGRYFLLTGEEIDAQEALRLGIVGEVLSPDALLPRAWEHARRLAALPPQAMRYTRIALTERLRAEMGRSLGYGLMLEGMAILGGREARGAS
ncbi:enoyl-CoA hydratase/isomerase family protein [Sphingomonas azotifigens]|uniref:enoyl-CoA hydratase/isomerase family protein n=1 Tax=Sphingomonas azotifigens TaxID=330920 RepID=UPI000A01F708|nr:enoyl-CoA hydratase/isomerase family protein [Sphingomonas azotifigens]